MTSILGWAIALLPVAGALMMALMPFAIALLVEEIALVGGRTRTATAV